MEGKNMCSLGSQSSFSIQIPQVKQKEIMSAWRKYVKQGTKKSAEEDGGEIILSQAVIPALGIDTFTVYAKTEATDRGVLFTSFIIGMIHCLSPRLLMLARLKRFPVSSGPLQFRNTKMLLKMN
ncbi:MAG: hypothetical protein IPF81_11670 [Bacteroidetes bacterium]|nr:hypothetical protein [Bacteroidota bacterium]